MCVPHLKAEHVTWLPWQPFNNINTHVYYNKGTQLTNKPQVCSPLNHGSYLLNHESSNIAQDLPMNNDIWLEATITCHVIRTKFIYMYERSRKTRGKVPTSFNQQPGTMQVTFTPWIQCLGGRRVPRIGRVILGNLDEKIEGIFEQRSLHYHCIEIYYAFIVFDRWPEAFGGSPSLISRCWYLHVNACISL